MTGFPRSLLHFFFIICIILCVIPSCKAGYYYYTDAEYNCTNTCDAYEGKDQQPFNVDIGLYLTQIVDLEPNLGTVYLSGYFWLIWKTCTIIDGEPFRPDLSIVVENSAQDWAAILIPEQDVPLCDTPVAGYSYQSFRFNYVVGIGFTYNKYPLDSQEIFMAFEDLHLDDKELVYNPMVHDTSYTQEELLLKGFWLKGNIAREYSNPQRTTFGLGGPQSSYSRAELGLKIERKPIFFVMKCLPPIIIVCLSSLLVVFVDHTKNSERLAIAPVSLLALIFLQVGFDDHIPDFSAVTILDWIFDYCYFLTLLLLFETCIICLWIMSLDKKYHKVEMGKVELDKEYAKKAIAHYETKRNIAVLIDSITGIGIFILGLVGIIVVIIIAKYA